MSTRAFDLWNAPPAQATKAFTTMRDEAIGGDLDATCQLALYAALTQILNRLDRMNALLERITPKEADTDDPTTHR